MKKGAEAPFFECRDGCASALRELEAAAGFLLAVLLALDDARGAGEETFLLERGAKLRLEVGQRLGDAVTPRARLAREPAAGNRHDDVELAGPVCDVQRLLQDHAQHRTREVALHRALVDDDLT